MRDVHEARMAQKHADIEALKKQHAELPTEEDLENVAEFQQRRLRQAALQAIADGEDPIEAVDALIETLRAHNHRWLRGEKA